MNSAYVVEVFPPYFKEPEHRSCISSIPGLHYRGEAYDSCQNWDDSRP
jgi:hypothetical protein